MSSQHGKKFGYEASDLDSKPVWRAGAGLVAVLLLTFALMIWVVAMLSRAELAGSRPPNPLAAEHARRQPPAPRLQSDPVGDLQQAEQETQALLRGYHWVDREQGIVRIPIEEAMGIIAARAAQQRDGEAPR